MAESSLVNPLDSLSISSATSNHPILSSKPPLIPLVFGTINSRKSLVLFSQNHSRIEAIKGRRRYPNQCVQKGKKTAESIAPPVEEITSERSVNVQSEVNGDDNEKEQAYYRDLLVQTYLERERLRCLLTKLEKGVNPIQILREDEDWHPDQFWFVMRYLKEQSRMKEALQVFECWKVLGMSRRDKLKYAKFVHFLSQAGLLQEAELLLEEMRNIGVKPTVTAYNSVMHAYAEKGLFEEADKVLKEMKECGLVLKPITFNGLIRAYGKRGRYDEMVNVLNRMRCEGCLPDQNTYNVLIQEFARGGLLVKMEEAYRTVISKRWRPDMTTLNAMVEAYATVGCLDKMEKIFRSIINRKYFLLESPLRRMALAYIESGRFYHLEKLVKEIGFERSDKALVWNLLLLSQACLLSCKGINSVTQNMKSAEFRPDITTINILAVAHLKMKNFTSLNCVFRQIRSLDIRPDLVTVGAVIDAYENGGDRIIVLEDWNRMRMLQCAVELKTDPVVLAALGKGNFHKSCERAFLSLDMAARKRKEWTYTDLIRLYFDSRNKGLDQSKL